MIQNGLLQQVSGWVSMQFHLLGDLVSSAVGGFGEFAASAVQPGEMADHASSNNPFLTPQGGVPVDIRGVPIASPTEAISLIPVTEDEALRRGLIGLD